MNLITRLFRLYKSSVTYNRLLLASSASKAGGKSVEHGGGINLNVAIRSAGFPRAAACHRYGQQSSHGRISTLASGLKLRRNIHGNNRQRGSVARFWEGSRLFIMLVFQLKFIFSYV